MFEEELDNRTRDDEAFQQVVDAVMDEIEERFAPAFLPDGKLQKTKVGWPLTWTWETGDRDAFIASISRFASNYAPLFGTLLTPLVNGVRVSGPFCPAWPNDKPKLVLDFAARGPFDGAVKERGEATIIVVALCLRRRASPACFAHLGRSFGSLTCVTHLRHRPASHLASCTPVRI